MLYIIRQITIKQLYVPAACIDNLVTVTRHNYNYSYEEYLIAYVFMSGMVQSPSLKMRIMKNKLI